MPSAAPRLNPAEARLAFATVRVMEDDTCMLEVDGQIVRARVAAGCLLRPSPGDRVLAAIADEDAFVTAVLELSDPSASRVDLPGRACLAARDGLRLAAPELDLAAGKLGVASAELDVSAERTTFTGRLLHSAVERASAVAKSLDLTVERLVGRFTSSRRYVEEVDELQAGTSRELVEGVKSVHAKTHSTTADGAISMTGKTVIMN
jgi:hypothetical protein